VDIDGSLVVMGSVSVALSNDGLNLIVASVADSTKSLNIFG
jgi:hypothetical protein